MPTTQEPNDRLHALLAEAGMTNKGLAKRMNEVSNADGGQPVAPSHTSVDKWLSGTTGRPKPRTLEVMAAVLGKALGRPITTDDLGYSDSTIDNRPSTPAREEPALTTEDDDTRADQDDNSDDTSQPAMVEQWIEDAHHSTHSRTSGNVGTVLQVGTIHGGISL